MPIITINDYTWRQTPEEIIITVPIKGKPTKIDIFAFDNYIKVRKLTSKKKNIYIYNCSFKIFSSFHFVTLSIFPGELSSIYSRIVFI